MGTPNHYGQHVGRRVVHLHWCPWSPGFICDPRHVLRKNQERYLMTIMAMWRPVNDDLGVSTQIRVANRSNGFLAKRWEFQGSPILGHPHLCTKEWSFTTFLHNWPRKPPKHSWHHFHGLIASHLSPSLPSRNKVGCCVYVALEQGSWKGLLSKGHLQTEQRCRWTWFHHVITDYCHSLPFADECQTA